MQANIIISKKVIAKLRFNWQYTQKADAESLPESGMGLNVKDFLFSIV
jgi:hypothetical protein